MKETAHVVIENVPGCFFLVGVLPDGRDEYPSLHSHHFDFPDTAIPTGMRMFTELVMHSRA